MTLARQAAGYPGGDKTSPNLLARLLALGRPLVMGVLNVTPDSFSDGGRFFDPAAAITQARRMVADGADILDIGAESTRPYGGAVAVPSAEEIGRLARVLPAAVALGVPLSIDTMKAAVAEWALGVGTAMVNDVWGLQRDGELARVVANHGVPVIIMHNREAADPSIDIMADISAFFSRSLEIAARAGIAGLTATQQSQYAVSYVNSVIGSYSFIDPTQITVATNTTSTTFQVTVSYNATNSFFSAVGGTLVPMPVNITRTATVQLSGF